ncbi:hypothetical protein E4T56_gene14665 [Termitomyces sp. T112]|nr:hypothetical protein E4T56_gene14665 [Termitomyces sp. T112]
MDAQLKYNMFCPILYFDPKKLDLSSMSKNAVLKRIDWFLLFGLGSLIIAGKLSLNAIGMKWGSIRTTSGLILACVNIAVYLLSGNKEFAATGKITTIPDSTTFCECKQFINQMASDHRSWVSQLFAKWDSVVFEGVPDAIHYPNTSPIYNKHEVAWQAILKSTGYENNLDTEECQDWSNDDSLGYQLPKSVLAAKQALAPARSSSPLDTQSAPSATLMNHSANSVQSASGLAMQRLATFPPSTTYSDSDDLTDLEEFITDEDQFSPAPT